MKSVFSGYLPLTQEESNTLLSEAIITFDTSSLFNLYRYEESTANEILQLLEELKNRLWLTYIAGLEYHSQRATVLRQQLDIYGKVQKKTETMKRGIAADFSDNEHFSIPVEIINDLVDGFETAIAQVLEESKRNHPSLLEKDHIRDRLVTIFEGRTGEPLSNEELELAYIEAKRRFDLKIPPGYRDAKNKEQQFKLYGNQAIKSEYSDYLIWKEVLTLAASKGKPIILVSDDRKDDWCWKEGSVNLGARAELVTEMKRFANVDFLLLTSKSFLEKLSKHIKSPLSKKSMSDIERAAEISWKEEVQNALASLGGKGTLAEIYEQIEKTTKRTLSSSWQSTARRTIYYYCPDTEIFLGKEDLFEQNGNSIYSLKNSEFVLTNVE